MEGVRPPVGVRTPRRAGRTYAVLGQTDQLLHLVRADTDPARPGLVQCWSRGFLAENTRRMVTGDGIGVTLIAPGRVDTNFWEPIGGPPQGLNLTADHIADALLWALGQPKGVDVNSVVIRPIGQSV